MGEIGVSPEYFERLEWWQMRSIIRGYNRRLCQLWSANRWQTYRIMEAQVGTDNLRKNGIHNPADLLPLPSDRKPSAPVSQEEIEMLQREMDAMNVANRQKP